MNVITKRVPREPTQEQIDALRATAEAFGFDVDARFDQMLRSAYEGSVSKAPIDPLEEMLEGILLERKGGAA